MATDDRSDDDTKPTRVATDGVDPDYVGPAPRGINPKTGQHESYWTLSQAERDKGFTRPVRRSYKHTKCNTVTTMAQAIAETFARDPKFYGGTFCTTCREHLPVAEFTWMAGVRATDEVVGE